MKPMTRFEAEVQIWARFAKLLHEMSEVRDLCAANGIEVPWLLVRMMESATTAPTDTAPKVS